MQSITRSRDDAKSIRDSFVPLQDCIALSIFIVEESHEIRDSL